MLCTILWKTILSALFISRMAAGENHVKMFFIKHGGIGLDIELIEEAEESATQEPRRTTETVPKKPYCNYPLPVGTRWSMTSYFFGFIPIKVDFIQLPVQFWGSTRCELRPEEIKVPGHIMLPCKSYDPYCQQWWAKTEKERKSGIEGNWTVCNTTDLSSAECSLTPDELKWVLTDNPSGVFWRYDASVWVKTQKKAGGIRGRK
jgi:hypothetical protein